MREELCNSDPIIEKENEIRERGRGRESFTKSILAFSGLSQILGPFLFPLVKISRSGFDKTVSPPLKSETLKPQTPFILFQISINTGTMIKLFKVKEKQRELAESANGKPPVKKQSAGELRLQKDISELNLPKTCSIAFPNGKDELMNFEVTIRPDEGYYLALCLGGTFCFSFQISPIYPHEAPKVKCKTKVYHPNIDLDGNVCLNILREDWKPVLNINTIIYGLYHLFTEPNHEDPLNHDAAAVLRDNPKMFESNVRRAMSGGYVGQTFFPRCV